jgi:hypothetical protein
MDAPEFVIAAISIVAGTGFAIFLLHNLFSFARFLVSNKKGVKGDGTTVTKAELDEVRGRLERRIQTLEAIIIDEQPSRLSLPETDPEDYASPASGLKNKLKTR